MPDASPASPAPAERLVLRPEVRRVLGVLIEKSLATPDYYPMTTKALVAGCNQKNNRHPVTGYSEDEVRDALSELQERRLVLAVKEQGSRATKWRHELQRLFNLQGKEQAVIAELLLRGPQAEGELRARASRMREVEDLQQLHEVLQALRERTPPFAVRLSAEGQVRGVRHAHALYPEDELERLREEVVEQGTASETVAAASARAGREEELASRLAALESRVARLESALGVEPESGE
jgi:uncharacterized protein YceH (UPF0502 family)